MSLLKNFSARYILRFPAEQHLSILSVFCPQILESHMKKIQPIWKRQGTTTLFVYEAASIRKILAIDSQREGGERGVANNPEHDP